MPANKTSFDVYAHVRHARQQAGDRKEQVLATQSYSDNKSRLLTEIENTLISVESMCEQLLKEDQI
jgi:hypothetical protein